MCRRTPVSIYSGSALFRWLDKQFNACSTRCVGSVTPHPPHAGTDIQLWPLAGHTSCSVGRYDRPYRPLEQTEQLFGNVLLYVER
jgi:hypothetical protein